MRNAKITCSKLTLPAAPPGAYGIRCTLSVVVANDNHPHAMAEGIALLRYRIIDGEYSGRTFFYKMRLDSSW